MAMYHKEGSVILSDGSTREIFLLSLNPGSLSTCGELFELNDGRLLVTAGDKTYVTSDYRYFENYPAPPENDGRSNLIRLKDGRVMGIVKQGCQNKLKNSLGGCNLYAVFSDDECKTFKDPVPISVKNERLYLMQNRLKRMKNGRILLPLGLHPDCLLEDVKSFENVGWMTCFVSDDEGQSWQPGEWLAPAEVDQLCEPTVEEMHDGTLKMIARTGRKYLFQSDSADGGITWSKEYATTLRSPLSPFNFAYDKYSGKYVVVWNDHFPEKLQTQPRTPFRLAVSDDAVHWDTVMTIGSNPDAGYGYPAIHFSKDEIHLSYYINSDITRKWDSIRLYFAAIPRNLDPRLAAK